MSDKKPYDVAERFTEVARRATEMQEHAKRKRPSPAAAPAVRAEPPDASAFPTRPGATMRKTGDVNLPDEGPALRALRRR